jgi:predicted naringenin-chalcone synthase
MQLQALFTANPPAIFTQASCAEIAKTPAVADRLTRRSQLILRSVLTGDSGIKQRHFALSDIPEVFDYSADRLNEVFRREAPSLAANALTGALARAGVRPDELDALFICTCTGYLCPGVTSYVAENLGLRSDAVLSDIVGHGCGAALPMLRDAHNFLCAQPDAVVATVAVEICSAAFYLDDDPGVLISACLFGDGAAAAIWRSRDSMGSGLHCRDFATLHRPQNRDEIRFEQRDGKLRNLLKPSVPSLAAEAVQTLLSSEQARQGARPIAQIAAHPGGREVINAVAERLPQFDFSAGRRVLQAYGNMSSPSVLFVLDELLKSGKPGADEDWWLVSFGAGFSAHSCRLGC